MDVREGPPLDNRLAMKAMRASNVANAAQDTTIIKTLQHVTRAKVKACTVHPLSL